MDSFELVPGDLTLKDVSCLLKAQAKIKLSDSAIQSIKKNTDVLKKLLKENKKIYGVNTGFGKLASKQIEQEDLHHLQHRLILSHASGVGDFLSDSIVALILLLKINALAQGYSGVRLEVIESLLRLYNEHYYPCIPSKGSVGASGDLAPLAHCAAIFWGHGFCQHDKKKVSADKVIKKLGIDVVPLQPKEGLALLNGTQVSTALAMNGLFKTIHLFELALIAGALSVDAACGSDAPFDLRLHKLRRLPEQSETAQILLELLENSEIRVSHVNCDRVQDPYSLRCQPQVMGACLAHIKHAARLLQCEINAVTDNPLIFSESEDIISGGNFHAESVGFAADALAMSLAEIGALSERRIALLIDSNLSGLPPFLVKNSGLNSGFMIAQVTAAALVSENKHLANSVSVDSIPTSANQEDHVSMATYAARRLGVMADNLSAIIAIELMAACQGLDFHKPFKTSSKLQIIYDEVRSRVPFISEDCYMSPYIETVKEMVETDILSLEKLGTTQLNIVTANSV